MRTLIAAAALLVANARKYNTNAKRIDAPGVLNVHVIAHTHDDVGWLKTVDEYYVGLNNTIQHAGVRHILDSTLDSLRKNPDRKFIYVEQAFFQRWWAEQEPAVQAEVKTFVQQGRLSFVNGGWCMHDEATTTYVDMVDNTQLGHRFITTEFGQDALPSVTWQIDPFGHSGTQASLLSSPASGYNALFVSRADYSDIAARTSAKSLEYVWTASESLGQQASTFFSIMNSGLHLYFPLPGLCWDAINCNDPEIQDDPLLDDYNVQDVVARTVASAQGQAQNYVGDIYFTQGFDFNYEYAEEWFMNMDKWIHWVNMNTSIHGVNLFYSTPQEYARTKISYPVSWPTKTNDDGFPYADGPHSYWTGFFTSRPALKGYVRDSSSYFQAAKQIQAISAPMYDLDPTNPLYSLMRAMGVAQHHDAVAGTEQQHVAYDYAHRIARGRLAADEFLQDAIPGLLGVEGASVATCDLANATICPALETLTTTVLYVYNSQAQAKTSLPLRIPIGTGNGAQSWSVYAGLPSSGKLVTAQMLPLADADTSLRTSYYKYNGNAPSTFWLAFQAPVPAVGLAAYTLVPHASAEEAKATTISSVKTMSTASAGSALRGKLADEPITNGLVTLTISATTGLLSHYTCTGTGVDVDMMNQWLWYNASVGNQVDGQASGAYIFRPNDTTTFPVGSGAATVTIASGPVVVEARHVVAPWLTQITRLWTGRTDFEIEYTVGPVPWADGLGKEVIARYSVPSIVSNATFYTDSNGRDMYKRVRDFRPSWNVTVREPVAGNYYPVNSAIQVSDVNNGLTLWAVNDRSQGGASIVDGSVELMVIRRLQADDGRGVGEPLNETGLDRSGSGLLVRGIHRLGLQPAAGAAAARRAAVQDVSLFRPLLTYGGLPAAMPKANVSALVAPLPANVHLLTLQSLSETSWMVRLAHLFGTGEDPVLSLNATVDLANMFISPFSSCSEMTLPGGQPLASVARTTYNVDASRDVAAAVAVDGAEVVKTITAPALPEDMDPAAPVVGNDGRLQAMPITLSPLQVRTFICSQ